MNELIEWMKYIGTGAAAGILLAILVTI